MKIFSTILALTLASCATPAQNAKLAAISNLALTYAEAKGAITPADAALVREAGKVVLAPEPEPTLPTIEVTASK